MATRANGEVQTPVSSFQFTIYTVPNEEGLNFLPEGEIGFSECSGLSDETEAVDFKEGNDLYIDKLPGQSKSPEITLSHGLDKSNYLQKWRAAVKERTTLPAPKYRCDVIITVWNRQGAPGAAEVPSDKITVWKLKKAWPKSLELGDLKATDSEINMMKLVLCCYGPPEQIFPVLSE